MESQKIGTSGGETAPRVLILDYALIATGAFPALIAVLVLAGWHTGTVVLVRGVPPGAPMVYNTALGLLLTGAGLIATAYRNRLPALVCGAGAAVIGVLCLLQGTTGANLGIDEFFHRDLISASMFPPGRMATTVALCLSISAGASLMACMKRPRNWHPWLLGTLGSIVASIGCAALLSYLSGATAPHSWGTFVPMAQHSSAAFTAVGAGIMIAAWREAGTHQSRSLTPLLAASVILTATLYLWCSVKATELRHVTRSADLAAMHVGSALKSQVEVRVLELVRMGRRSEVDTAMTRREWEADARLYLQHYSGYHSLIRLQPSLETRWSVAQDPLSPALDFAGLGEAPRAALDRARATGGATTSRSIRLPGGRNVFLICVPLSSGKSFEGYVVGVLTLEPLLGSVIENLDPGVHSIAIFDGAEKVYSRQQGPALHLQPGTAAVDLWGTPWQVRVLPAQNRSILTPIILLVGCLVAALSIVAGLLAQTAGLRAREAEAANRKLQHEIAERQQVQEALSAAQVELEARVQQRTAELARTNQELTAEIAERRRAEETLRASEQRYRELFDGAKDLIYVHDLNGNFVSINKAAQQITGYTAEEALKMNIAQLVAPEDLESVHAMVASNLGGDPNATYDLTIISKDGRRLLLEMSTHLVYRNGNPVAVQGIARDITERKRLEEQFLQSQKMEAVGRLAGGVAHDFNNLLTVIGAYSQMISDSLPDDQRLRGYAQEILWAAERAGTLTNRLLAFSRRQVVQPRVVDLNGLIVTLDNMLRRLIGEDIELKTVLEPGAGAVKADPNHLEQVIMNLAVNARDAMRTGGRLTLRTSRVDLGPPADDSPVLPPGSYVVLEVSDSGAGMSPDVLAHIFEPFFTTKEAGKGTGLGLSTVYGIVKQCGGDILVRSKPGEGAHFTLYFPRAGSQDAPSQEPTRACAPPQADREVILLVEDEYGVRKLVRKMLLQQGYRVLEAASGEEALNLSEQHSGSIHLLLSDVVMPNMSGRELAERLCAVRPEVKVLYMTGYTDDAIVQHRVLEPGVAMLNKPFLSDALARKLREVLDNTNGKH